jgi:glycosyltransferase involved in cell wall biosynthesis
VSVVVPTFNRPAYLSETLASILAQSFSDFEVIVGNDGDARLIDAVREVHRDHRIIWIDNEDRLGMMQNNLACFARARGTFIANLHDDDRWAPELLATLVPRLEADAEIAVAFADHFIIDAHGNVDEEATNANTVRWRRDELSPQRHQPFREIAVVDRSIPVQCAAVFRRDAVDFEDFPDAVEPFYDLWIAYQLARDGAAAYYDPTRLAYYRSHAASQTAVGIGNAQAGIYCFGRFLEDPRLEDVPRRPLRRLLAGSHYAAGVRLLREGRRRPALNHFAHAFALGYRGRPALAIGASALPRAVLERL